MVNSRQRQILYVKIDCLTKPSNLPIAHQSVEVKRPWDQVPEAPLFSD